MSLLKHAAGRVAAMGLGLAAIMLLAVQDASAQQTSESDLPTVAIVTTGGTIAERSSGASGGAVPAVTGKALVDSVPGLRDLADLEVVDVSDIDSSQMTPALWLRLHAKLEELLVRDDIEGAVVVHGTDTMSEGAFLIDVLLTSNKPVVFTGAMRDASSPDPDGPANLLNAVRQVLSEEGQGWGVTVSLNNYINAARYVRKMQTTNVQTFTSDEKGYLGYIFDGKVTRFNEAARRIRLPLEGAPPDELPDVPLLADYAGSDGRFIRHAVDSGAAGIVVQGVGAGNVNAASFAAIKHALDKGVPVVVTTRVLNGAVEPVYADPGGGKTLEEAGVILAGDLLTEKARLLLLVGLIRYGQDHDRLHALFRN